VDDESKEREHRPVLLERMTRELNRQEVAN